MVLTLWGVLLSLVVFSTHHAAISAQTIRSHSQYKCDDAGDMSGERLKRTINYARCLNPPASTRAGTTQVWQTEEEICHNCKCQIAEYWEIAKYCFEEDASYQYRVAADKWRYDELWKQYCMPSGSMKTPMWFQRTVQIPTVNFGAETQSAIHRHCILSYSLRSCFMGGGLLIASSAPSARNFGRRS